MLNDDEQFYMEREFTCCDWRDSAPIEYVTESEEYSDEDSIDYDSEEYWERDDLEFDHQWREQDGEFDHDDY